MPRSNTSECPGSDVILELLRAEHEQVKRRTDLIKQLITYNCSPKSGKKTSGDKSHAISKNELCNNTTSMDSGKSTKPNSASHSAMQLANLKALNTTPTYSQFQSGAIHQSTPKKPLRPTKLNSRNINTTANQTEDSCVSPIQNPACNGYDYKLETHKLMQEVTELKNASKRYEDEKSDWINEKRRQIRILQQLRDASYDETKAAMKLTSWKASDIECNPTQYEESKRTWLLCKKNQIELLEQLRGVSLSEIKKGIERLSNPNMKGLDYEIENDRCQSTMDFTYLNQPCGQELYNSDKISVRLCGPEIKSECFDKEKININIMMKSNSNITTDMPSITESFKNSQKGAPFRHKKPMTSNSNRTNVYNRTINLKTPLSPKKTIKDTVLEGDHHKTICHKMPSTSTCIIDSLQSKESAVEMKRQIEDTIGTKLFENTYNILSQLNCPQLILKADNDSFADAQRVYNYILEERRIRYSDENNLAGNSF